MGERDWIIRLVINIIGPLSTFVGNDHQNDPIELCEMRINIFSDYGLNNGEEFNQDTLIAEII